MATPVKISELPLLSTAPSTSVEFAINDSGTTKKLTLDNLMTRVGSLSSLSAGITNTSIVNAINSIYALDASLSNKGFVNTTGQAFAGDKTFANSVILDGNQLSFKSNGSNYAVLKARTTQSGSYIMYLPESIPGSTQFVTLNSSGQLATTSGVVTSVATGTGLTGGPITSTGTISLAASGVVSGTYGNTLNIPVFTVDTYGRITNAINTPIQTANAGQSGILSSTDYNSFTNKFETPSLTDLSVPYWDSATSTFTETVDFLIDNTELGARVLKAPGVINTKVDIKTNMVTYTTNSVMDGTQTIVFLEPGSGANLTATLPDSSTINTGQIFYFKVSKTGGASIKVIVQGSDYINASGTVELSLNTTNGNCAIIKKGTNNYQTLYTY